MSLTSVYSYYAPDGGVCTFFGQKSVAYTSTTPSGYLPYYRNASGSIACNKNTFGGDPTPGYTTCTTDPLGYPWGSSQPIDVLYSGSGSYVYVNTTGTYCDSQYMGNVPGARCYYRVPSSNTTPTTTPTTPTTTTPTTTSPITESFKETFSSGGKTAIIIIAIIILIVLIYLLYRWHKKSKTSTTIELVSTDFV